MSNEAGAGSTVTPVSFDSGRLSHAYIVSGELADALAVTAVCSGNDWERPCGSCIHCSKALRQIHPDIIFVSKLPDKREILVDQIRRLKKDVIVVPNEADRKVYIVNDADTMNTNAQNAFLQILEEPPKFVVFILRTDNPAALLPTVRSRCMELKATQKQDAPDIKASEIAGEFFSAIKRGNAQLTAFMFRLEKLDKNIFPAFLSAAREQAALMLKAAVSGPFETSIPPETLARAESILVKAEEMSDLNVSPGHISGMICASLIDIT